MMRPMGTTMRHDEDDEDDGDGGGDDDDDDNRGALLPTAIALRAARPSPPAIPLQRSRSYSPLPHSYNPNPCSHIPHPSLSRHS
eukprot:7289711-Pyramimonas_sp.AAC.1